MERFLTKLAMIACFLCFGIAPMAQAKELGPNGRINASTHAWMKENHISEDQARHMRLGTIITIDAHDYVLDGKPLRTVWGVYKTIDHDQQLTVAQPPASVAPAVQTIQPSPAVASPAQPAAAAVVAAPAVSANTQTIQSLAAGQPITQPAPAPRAQPIFKPSRLDKNGHPLYGTDPWYQRVWDWITASGWHIAITIICSVIMTLMIIFIGFQIYFLIDSRRDTSEHGGTTESLKPIFSKEEVSDREPAYEPDYVDIDALADVRQAPDSGDREHARPRPH